MKVIVLFTGFQSCLQATVRYGFVCVDYYKCYYFPSTTIEIIQARNSIKNISLIISKSLTNKLIVLLASFQSWLQRTKRNDWSGADYYTCYYFPSFNQQLK